eukprot:3924904-Amphidinium_carterae.1
MPLIIDKENKKSEQSVTKESHFRSRVCCVPGVPMGEPLGIVIAYFVSVEKGKRCSGSLLQTAHFKAMNQTEFAQV